MKKQPKKIIFTPPRTSHPDTLPQSLNEEVIERSRNAETTLHDWIDSQDVMQLLHISPRTLHTLRTNGTLPHSRIGYKFYYRKQDIQKILSDNYTMYKIKNYDNK
jgi:hypothetical protein